MRSYHLLLLLSLFSTYGGVHGWMNPSMQQQRRQQPFLTRRAVSASSNENNPCWQDLYDDDCSMESVFAASFVASKWIKSMPCAAGLEVSTIVRIRSYIDIYMHAFVRSFVLQIHSNQQSKRNSSLFLFLFYVASTI
jgi:hypothetical protein